MSRRFSSRALLFLVFAIIVFYVLSMTTTITLLEYDMKTYAGTLSVALATFIFVQAKIIGKKIKISRTLLEITLLFGGLLILIPQAYNYILQYNTMLDILIIIAYTILLLLVAFFTRNEHVKSKDIKQANHMARGEFKKDPKLKKMLKH